MLPEELLSKSVYRFFQEICDIPHPSYHEEAISNYLVNFAKERGFEYYQDSLFNVIIIREACPECQDKDPIIIQGHMDMVCEKESDCEVDMEREGLDIYVDGDYIKARGTTLGADDGIAVACALAILDDDSLKTPRIEFICTVSEEVGMEGAQGLDVSHISGKRMLNIDNEEEGHFLAGCAGGGTIEVGKDFSNAYFEGLKKDTYGREYVKALISVKNLQGGHSGVEIHKGRANANILMARILEGMDNLINKNAREGFLLESISGGSKDNAIPRECQVQIIFEKDNQHLFENMLGAYEKIFRNEFKDIEPNLSIEFTISERVELCKYEDQVLTSHQIQNLYHLVLTLPNGLQAMSRNIPGMVETSLNLGVMKLDEGKLLLRYCVRSEVDQEYARLTSSMEDIASEYGAEMTRSGEYPAWEYMPDSPFRDRIVKEYSKMFGREPIVETVHAGVECGILAQKIEGLETVAIGPEILDIHTPAERLSISSTDRTYEFVKKLITM